MNDFTKDELHLLRGCVFTKFVIFLNDPSIEHLQNDLKNIKNKIALMIDNYCEHEKKVSSSDDNGHMVVQCG